MARPKRARKAAKKKKARRGRCPVPPIYLRVRQRDLLPMLDTVEASSLSDPPPAGHLYLIKGTLDDVKRYAGTTVDWLIKVAQLICDPLPAGKLYTYTTGTAIEWYSQDRTPSWRQVIPGDRLRHGIYEFEPTGPIHLSRISERYDHSVTTAGSKSDSATFISDISRRDGPCVVTGLPDYGIASHLIPKRIGSDGVKDVAPRFVGEKAAEGIHKYDARIGIQLFFALSYSVDTHQLGFYHVAGDTYTLHNFSDPALTILVLPPIPSLPFLARAPLLHRFPVTLSVHAGLPFRGVFDWHYLQCVLRKFATEDYNNYPSIRMFEYPFKTADEEEEEEDEYTDNDETDPPYPSYHFDRFREEH